MAEAKQVKVKPVRLIVRVSIPEIAPGDAGSVHAAISEAIATYPKASIELSLGPTLPTR